MSCSLQELRGLVTGDRVHRRVYADPEIFALEMDRIFGRAWLYVAHESQLKTPGDFVRTRMGLRDMVVARHADGTIHVLHNRCSHRGARFCAADRGNARSFICPYHGWSFATDGALEGVPHRQSYPDGFRLDDPGRPLFQAPRVESYRGFVFASLAASGPSLTEHLGPMTEAFDNLVDRAPEGEVEISDHGFRLEYRGNWKMHHENANDVFHPSFVHESSITAARRLPAKGSRFEYDLTHEQLRSNDRTPRDWENAHVVGLPMGHSYRAGFYRGGALAPGADDDARARYRAALVARRGEQRAAEILGVDRFNNLIFPNISLNAQYHQLRVVHPVAVDRTVVASYCFRLKGAPTEIFERAVRFLSNIGSPASMIYSDDAAVFARCQEGLSEEGNAWVDFSRNFGRDQQAPDGALSGTASELPMRVLYQGWLDLMTAGAE
jgi:nitrite reductase/ring-hydroxylating ferredoxin subunit